METFTSVLEFLTYWLVDQYWFPAFLIGSGIFFTVYLGFLKSNTSNTVGEFLAADMSKKIQKGKRLPSSINYSTLGNCRNGKYWWCELSDLSRRTAAIFWMWITAFFGMTTKFVEVTLAHKYRETLTDGSISGGPMYYIENGLNMKWLAILFLSVFINVFGNRQYATNQ